jgi:hypothetical protein
MTGFPLGYYPRYYQIISGGLFFNFTIVFKEWTTGRVHTLQPHQVSHLPPGPLGY